MISSKKPKLPNFILLFTPFYKYKITGNSMYPALNEGDFVLVNRLAYLFKKPQKKDIVAVRDPRDKKILIKRIIKIKNGLYFIQGDNKEHSTDSRKFGMIDKKNIIGKVFI